MYARQGTCQETQKVKTYYPTPPKRRQKRSIISTNQTNQPPERLVIFFSHNRIYAQLPSEKAATDR